MSRGLSPVSVSPAGRSEADCGMKRRSTSSSTSLARGSRRDHAVLTDRRGNPAGHVKTARAVPRHLEIRFETRQIAQSGHPRDAGAHVRIGRQSEMLAGFGNILYRNRNAPRRRRGFLLICAHACAKASGLGKTTSPRMRAPSSWASSSAPRRARIARQASRSVVDADNLEDIACKRFLKVPLVGRIKSGEIGGLPRR